MLNKIKPRLVATAISALLCAFPAAMTPAISAAQNLPTLGDTERQELSPIAERKLGDEIMRDIRRDPDYMNDAPLLEYLNNFGNTLVAARPEVRGDANYDFFFFVVRDKTLNAFALPGGFIGVHSALVLAAQNESELASVLAHEIGHVAQRHIARMVAEQKQNALIPLASIVLAALAARSSPDASSALIMGGQGVAVQRQLSFSRNAEREADRVGLQIMRDAGYDTRGMISFFGRLQSSTRAYSDVPAFMQSHPLTTERIADIQARTRDFHYKQRADSLDFYLVRARLRVLQDSSPEGLYDAEITFNEFLQQHTRPQIVAGKYGLAFIAYKRRDYAKAQALLQEAKAAAQGAPLASLAGQSPIFADLSIAIKLAANKPADAVKEADAARNQFPLSHGIAHQYAEALMESGRYDDAIHYLRDQSQLYREEPEWQDQLAKAYAAQGKQALQHLALAESYALTGSLPAAIEQLDIARRSSDASFYDQSVIDARDREFKARWKEESKDQKKN